MRSEVDLAYCDFRRRIIDWINEGRGSVTPSMVAKILRDELGERPRPMLEAEVRILETSRDWGEAFGRATVAFPKSIGRDN